MSDPLSLMDVSSVKVVSGYALQQKIGSGSFATVYKAVRLQSTEVVAIKAITRTSEKLTKKVLQNLEIEIQILRTYKHPNIVCLVDVQKTERHFYLILEYCGGGDVQKLIRTRKAGRISEGLTRRLMRDLAAGLGFLWGQELIHRDIKPQNLLLTGCLPIEELSDPESSDELEQQRREANFPSEQYVLKIADFGFARHLQSASLAETLCGSPLYMAPEILQHHRYDAKADLWSVGTVLFEMITGRPPFHGENHIDLLRNIQRKAVRLPPDVQVSKECVNLLRLLLNRNPLSRAGFKEFFEACNAFVALGCNGVATVDVGTCRVPLDLGTIPENEGAESMITVATSVPQSVRGNQPSIVTPSMGPTPTPAIPIQSQLGILVSTTRVVGPTLTPLVPSPPTSSASPIFNSLEGRVAPPSTDAVNPSRESEENSFVMVEHSSLHKSPTASLALVSGGDPYKQAQVRLDPSPPSSPSYYMRKPIIATRGDYMVVKQPKGMLSTSPGTGGALMGWMSGRRLMQDDASSREFESGVKGASKMLATAEDVGRRAVSVAHLGDQRAYAAMKLLLNDTYYGSSVLSTAPMEGIEEEAADGTVTDDSTEIIATVHRRRSSSATDRSMTDARATDQAEEMPFALHAESPPLITTGMPSRESASYGTGVSITSARLSARPTPAVIRAHFGEALSCYLKALKLLKGAIAASQGVAKDLDTLSTMRLTGEQSVQCQKLAKRCEGTMAWLSGQFQGVLERGEATNAEIAKLSSQGATSERVDPSLVSAEELIYNHALGFGREGAVKQLLGQFDSARSCYRTAGLLAETLLMESSLQSEDRKVLEDCVDGFAARITELDESMLQQSRLAGSSATASLTANSLKRGVPVIGLVGHPFVGPSLSLDPVPR